MLIDALWLNVSPSLKKLDEPLLNHLSQRLTIAQWEYLQDPDEANSIFIAMSLLNGYLEQLSEPVHLLGHGTGGLLGLMYARRYPEKIRSLTLLGVGVYPAIDWQAHYYFKLQMLPCSRHLVLGMMVQSLFGYQSGELRQEFIEILDQDLKTSLCSHNLYRQLKIFPGGVLMPLLVCGSENDVVVDQNSYQGWQTWLKPGDRLRQFPLGRYFFHYFYPQAVGKAILDYWSDLPNQIELKQSPIGNKNHNIIPGTYYNFKYGNNFTAN
ncbi:alpha/beta fold hydrolase [Gloeocapsa sp. PCC 73106]|uniref:alpha/beta fold hydrolase n=1 Tax=Gloeocapsa sp. PCC 73106 TaxID=102232 RepID=UPI0002AC767D|nr:alpha/beta fold hydrolase [Gloeocapsa sp. PCC 73106]ELR97652.1 putative hydrolase or acyltransferase of alpha/beta superfamily [Gloeocapsa sp. PCC 73106]